MAFNWIGGCLDAKGLQCFTYQTKVNIVCLVTCLHVVAVLCIPAFFGLYTFQLLQWWQNSVVMITIIVNICITLYEKHFKNMLAIRSLITVAIKLAIFLPTYPGYSVALCAISIYMFANR